MAINNRSKGIQEGKKAAEYPQMGKFGAHPPPVRALSELVVEAC
jgi:hypothetical protein